MAHYGIRGQPHHYPEALCFPSPAPRTPIEPPELPFDKMISARYADSEKRLWNAVSLIGFPNASNKHQCTFILERLRVRRHLFMHTYDHLTTCCQRSGRNLLPTLEAKGYDWIGQSDVQQLASHSLIRDELIGFGMGQPCNKHKFIFTRDHVIRDDESDLLCHLLYCGRRQSEELYQLVGYNAQAFKSVMELNWELLQTCREIEVARRLRSQIYRLAKKSGYLPNDLLIEPRDIQNEVFLPGAAGAQGMITQATMNGSDVVIKRFRLTNAGEQTKRMKEFAKEAIMGNTLRHRNLVPFLGVVMDDQFRIGLVSPYFKNGNMRAYMKKYDRKKWYNFAQDWAKDLAKGLEYLHSHEPPIVHGDLKGVNVLIDDARRALLGDFGLSHVEDSGRLLNLHSTRSANAIQMGLWIAPEIYHGGDRVRATDKSDVFSFGCVLYEMLSDQNPFEECHRPSDAMSKIMKGEGPKRPELRINKDDPLWKLAERCWKLHPRDRPSAARLVSDLRHLIKGPIHFPTIPVRNRRNM